MYFCKQNWERKKLVQVFLQCLWGSRFNTEGWRFDHGSVPLKRHLIRPWKLCSVSLGNNSANTTKCLSHKLSFSLFCQIKGFLNFLLIFYSDDAICYITGGCLIIIWNRWLCFLTVFQRLHVLYWSLHFDPWIRHSPETPHWTLKTLLCPPHPPLDVSSWVLRSFWGETPSVKVSSEPSVKRKKLPHWVSSEIKQTRVWFCWLRSHFMCFFSLWRLTCKHLQQRLKMEPDKN